MLKQALRSYLASLHPRNYKKIKNGTFLGLCIYWFVISPIINDFDHSGEAVEQIWFYAVILTPFLLMWWSNLEHKLSMPKLMYMLPTKAEGRRKYLHALLVIKIGFPVLVAVILRLIHGAIYGMDWLQIFLSSFAILSFGIGMYVCSELRSKFDRYIRYAVRGKDGTGKDAWLNWMCMIYAVIYLIVIMGLEVEGGTLGLLDWAWTLGFLSIHVIMDIAIIKTRYKATIEDVCNYEEAFNVLGKVKK